jgi:hypothetical protein
MKPLTPGGFVICVLAAASACGGGRKPVEIDPQAAPVANRWNGTLGTPADMAGAIQIRGQAWMGPAEGNPDRTQAYAAISNAAPGGEHPWHVHRGRCGSDQGILGPADSYGLLKVNDDGNASSSAELAMPVPKTGSYFVNVHASRQNMRTIVACGNLAPPAR